MAEAQFRVALKADPTLSRVRNNFAAFLYSQDRFSKAEREFATVNEDTFYRSRPMAFLNLGLCRLQLDTLRTPRRRLPARCRWISATQWRYWR